MPVDQVRALGVDDGKLKDKRSMISSFNSAPEWKPASFMSAPVMPQAPMNGMGLAQLGNMKQQMPHSMQQQRSHMMMPNVHNISSQQRAFLLQQQQQQRNLQMRQMQQGMVSQQMPLQRQRGPNAPRINARDARGARPMMSNGVGSLMPQMSQPANATSEKSKMQPQADARNRIAQRGQHIRNGSNMTPQNQPMGRAMPRNVRMQGMNPGNFQQQQMMPNNVMSMHMTPGMAPHGYPQQHYANSYQQMQRGPAGNSGARGPVRQGPRGGRSMMNVQSQKPQSSKPNPPAPAKAKTNFLLEAVRQKVERERKEEEAKLKAQKERKAAILATSM